MEVVAPVPTAMDFNFDSTCSSPYMTAPSSPQRFGNFFFSAPTSPTRVSSLYRELNDLSHLTNSSSAVPFQWEEKPGTPKRKGFDGRGDKNNIDVDDGCEDFEFNFSGQLERTSLSADELFDGGKIRPLKPPPGYDQFSSTVSSPRSPKSRAFRKKDFDPFEAAIEKSRKRVVVLNEPPQQDLNKRNSQSQQRGRERNSVSSSSSSSSSYNYVHKKSRSLSPFRVSDIMFEQDEEISSQSEKTIASTTSNPKSYVSSILSAISFSKGSRKWKLKDLLLFRSASEGRATSNDPLMKFSILTKKEPEDVKNSSFRSTESIGSVSSRRRAPVSAHELHYTANRAVSEEMRRKTFLPYKQGLLGCLGFNPGMHELSRGIGSLTRG
ncbi:hypothetical protein REPUB_Repub04eG0069700 [Reevesia pubescens]